VTQWRMKEHKDTTAESIYSNLCWDTDTDAETMWIPRDGRRNTSITSN